jgi:hypothetical protein
MGISGFFIPAVMNVENNHSGQQSAVSTPPGLEIEPAD